MNGAPTSHGLTPYLYYDDAEAMLEWYSTVFGWVEIGRWLDDAGQVQNAEISTGDGELWLDGGGWRWFDADGGRAVVWTGVWVDDVDAVFDRVRAAGLEVDPPVTRDFGIRMLTVTDPAGYEWGFQARIPGSP